MAHERLMLPGIYTVPNTSRDAHRHVEAQELVVHVNVQMERKICVVPH